MGVVPKKTKAEQRIMRHISVTKIVGFIMTLALSKLFGDMFVHSSVRILFIIFCSVEFFIVTSDSPSDPTKKFYAGWLDWIGFILLGRKKYVKEEEVRDETFIESEK